MKFPHQELIESNEINIKDLPSDLKKSIELFNEKFQEFETAEEEHDQAEVRELKAELKKISSRISSEIKEHLDEEELSEDQEDEKMPDDKEGILRYLYEKGIKKVTKEDLKMYGYPVGFFGSLPMKGETIGQYRLFRTNTNQPFELSKIK